MDLSVEPTCAANDGPRAGSCRAGRSVTERRQWGPVDSCQLARFVGFVDSSEDARLIGVLLILVLDR